MWPRPGSHDRHLALARRFSEAEPELAPCPLPLFSASLPAASAMAELGETPLLLALLSLSSSPAVRSNVAPVTTAGHAAPFSHFPGHRSRRSRPAAAAAARPPPAAVFRPRLAVAERGPCMGVVRLVLP